MDPTVPSSHLPLPFLASLLRPHVRDYESMNLVLDHLGTFCDNALLVARLMRMQNLTYSPAQMFAHSHARMALWPLDSRVNPAFRDAVRDFAWRDLYDKVIADEHLVRFYQTNRQMFMNRRSGSIRWLVNGAARADLGPYGFRAFGLDVLTYLEPIATMQAFHSDFAFGYVERDVSGEDLHWFSHSFLRHWDQAFWLLEERHGGLEIEDARGVVMAFVRLGVSVVDVFVKYWFQRAQDGAAVQHADGDFGDECERATQSAIERQWKVDVDSPFAHLGAEPTPLHIRTVLARADHARARRTFFNTVAYLAESMPRDDLHGEVFTMLLDSVRDWAAVTGNEEVIDALMDAISEDEWPWPFTNESRSAAPYRPLGLPPVILYYDLPDELPAPTDADAETEDSDTSEEVEEEESLQVRWPQPGRARRLLNLLNPFHTPRVGPPFEFVEVPLKPYGPRIDPHAVAHPCKVPQDDTCVICLEDYLQEEDVQQPSATGESNKEGAKARLTQLRQWASSLRGELDARKERKGKRAMQLDQCSHIFHIACLRQLLNQAYPKTGEVRCPCCRAPICASRPFRAVRGNLDRLRYWGR